MSFLLSAWWLWLIVMGGAGIWVLHCKSDLDWETLVLCARSGNREATTKLYRSARWKIWAGTAVTAVACVLFAVSMVICVGNIGK